MLNVPTYGNFVCISIICDFKWSISIDVARRYQIRNQTVPARLGPLIKAQVDMVISKRLDVNMKLNGLFIAIQL